MGAGVEWWEGILGRGSSRFKVAWRVVWGYCQPRVGGLPAGTIMRSVSGQTGEF